jgi:LysM repeat protein
MRTKGPGPERFVLAFALLVPLCVAVYAAAQVPGIDLRLPSTIAYADPGASLSLRRPVNSAPTPPPTLAPAPTPTHVAVSASVPTPAARPTPTERTYTVKPGDELKHIAADYGVNIWKIINANDIPDPDSLRVGQVLRIPDS